MCRPPFIGDLSGAARGEGEASSDPVLLLTARTGVRADRNAACQEFVWTTGQQAHDIDDSLFRFGGKQQPTDTVTPSRVGAVLGRR